MLVRWLLFTFGVVCRFWFTCHFGSLINGDNFSFSRNLSFFDSPFSSFSLNIPQTTISATLHRYWVSHAHLISFLQACLTNAPINCSLYFLSLSLLSWSREIQRLFLEWWYFPYRHLTWSKSSYCSLDVFFTHYSSQKTASQSNESRNYQHCLFFARQGTNLHLLLLHCQPFFEHSLLW